MKIEQHVHLKDKVTLRIGGWAKNFYIPESAEEASLVLKETGDQVYILSGGSNLLINDDKEFENVIYAIDVDKSLEYLGNGRFYIGASNRIQKVIQFVNSYGYGGFEELIGLPALFGGIIYMNAGIGGREQVLFNIADFIQRVKCIDRKTKKVIWIEKEDCKFSYRSSLFQEDGCFILGAELELQEQDITASSARISKRKKYCQEKQEWGKGCFGSCFSTYDKRILSLVRKLVGTANHERIYISRLNNNWLVNGGEGRYCDVMRIIKMAQIFHKLCRKELKTEVCIWK